MKEGLTFYTNMPTPYQLDLLDSLCEYFNIKAVYFTAKEMDRKWTLPLTSDKYNTVTLKNSWVAKIIQHKIISFHYSSEILRLVLSDKNQNVIVNGTYWSPNVILAILISRCRRKKVFFLGEPLFPTKSKLKFLVKKFLLWPVRLGTNGILAVGRLAERSYIKYGYKKPIKNIPYSINMDLFDKANLLQPKLEMLEQKYKSEEEVVFLTSGSLIARKGIDIVISSFLKLNKTRSTRLLILGDGIDKDALLKLTNGDSRVEFLGFIEKEEVPYFFAISDVFVFASRYDGWGLVINEAIASDLAIISSDKVGAATDVLLNDENALICPSEDVGAFEIAMNRMLDIQLRSRLRKEATKVKDLLSSTHNAKIIHEFFSMA